MPIKNKTLKRILLSVLILILITNWQGFKNLTGLNDWYYMFSNKSGSFTLIEEPKWGLIYKKPPGGQFSPNDKKWLACKDFVPKNDTIVYRVFAINPLKFWRWGEYIFNWRYKLPYTDWEEVKKLRGNDPSKFPRGCRQI